MMKWHTVNDIEDRIVSQDTNNIALQLTPSRRNLVLFIGIISAPSNNERRTAGRETWIKECTKRSDVVCKYFTDSKDSSGNLIQGEEKEKLDDESQLYGDLVRTETPGGLSFSVKLLWILQWANDNYDFKYYLRLDDDYFICLNKLMLELASNERPKHSLQWGWLHCELYDATFLDESFLLLTSDIVESF
ncbi:probable beta-1,3-galactosyltransferase 8 [Xenia sp. Carnegie-2017]|uniref:probable beta-1,3-galactosyltransferase 8 n=1 Tax=Xenia sp. Carnegie-2017 TaxID=2897299 RepID=UPI001F0428F5|nr:probable beta-1,3-galactosyltransferase 8 [Xenia sp. Carnegie-2017]